MTLQEHVDHYVREEMYEVAALFKQAFDLGIDPQTDNEDVRLMILGMGALKMTDDRAAVIRDHIAKGAKYPRLSCIEPARNTANVNYKALYRQMSGSYNEMSERFRALYEPIDEELHQRALKMVQKTHRKLRLKDIAVGLLLVKNYRNMTVEYTFGNRTVLKALLHEGGYTLKA